MSKRTRSDTSLSDDEGKEEEEEENFTQSAVTYHERYNDPKANVVLVAADGVRFRVDDFYLKGNSPFFLEMMSGDNQSSDIPMEEDSLIVAVTLDLLTEGNPNREEIRLPNFARSKEVVDMVDKYEFARCDQGLNQIIKRYTKGAPIDTFIWGCQRSNTVIVQASIALFKDKMKYHGEEISLSPWFLPLKIFQQLPQHAIYAYFEACQKNKKLSPAKPECLFCKHQCKSEANLNWIRVSQDFQFPPG